jgi:hypothetical protein
LFDLARTANIHPRIHFYAVRTLSAWLACNPMWNVSLLLSPDFRRSVGVFARECPSILLNLLTHHFDLLLPHYIQTAYLKDQEAYFSAIAAFFRAHSMRSTITTETVLRDQWESCSDSCDAMSARYLNVLYENCGSLILSGLFFLSRSDKKLAEEAFLILGSLAPVLSIVHMEGRADDVPKLIDEIRKTSVKIEQSFSSVDMQSIGQISSLLCGCFQFCMEQLLSDACEFISGLSRPEIHRMLIVLRPWFAAIEFDLENRVISGETDLLFKRFSCFSFVHSLMLSFSKSADAISDSEVFNMWKTLVAPREFSGNRNFFSVFLSVIYAAFDSKNHDLAQLIIVYLFRIDPALTSTAISQHFSFGYSAHVHFRETDEAPQGDESSDDLADVDEDRVIRRSSRSLMIFLLKIVKNLILDSVRPFIPSLPTIFSFCMVHLFEFFGLISELIAAITAELLPLIGDESAQFMHDINASVNALTIQTRHSSRSLGDMGVPDPHLAHAPLITRAITHFFLNHNQEMAKQMGLELLQWGMCCGDLHRASYAIAAYRGNLAVTTNLIVDLTARTLWSVTDAVKIIVAKNQAAEADLPSYLLFMSEHLKMLKSVATCFVEKGTLASDSTLLWIAIETLRCNGRETAIVFDAALALLDYLFSFPQLFGFLAAGKNYSPEQLTMASFTKFHQPWGDSFHGLYRSLYEHESLAPNMDALIRVINKVIQTNFIGLFADAENAIYIAVLSLLPWMWSVVITDNSRYIYDSPSVLMMEATKESMRARITDTQVLDALLLIGGNEEVDVFSLTSQLCAIIVPRILTADLVMLAKFFTNCLKFGHKSMKSPLYSIVANVIRSATEPEPLVRALSQFTSVVASDKNESRRSYTELYLGVLPTVPEIEELLEEARVKWPEMEMFERIVAVNIPHLYDVSLSELSNISITDLNSFPPLLPWEPILLENERFGTFYDVLAQLRFEPFMGWSEWTAKLLASLVRTDDLDGMSHSVKFAEIKVHSALRQVLDKLDAAQAPVVETGEEGQEQPEEVAIEAAPEEAKDPYSFVFVVPDLFLPSLDEINVIGLDQYDDQGGFDGNLF